MFMSVEPGAIAEENPVYSEYLFVSREHTLHSMGRHDDMILSPFPAESKLRNIHNIMIKKSYLVIFNHSYFMVIKSLI